MKITDVKTFLVGDHPQWLFVKIDTDEGVHGWGEGSLATFNRSVATTVDVIANRVEGRDPTQIEKLWQAMYRHGFWKGGPVIGSAISAIDQALWDITGKVYGQPVYKLLGGPVRDRIRTYTHAHTPETARAAVDAGWDAFKTLGWEVGTDKVDERRIPDILHERIKGLRAEVGPDIEIMIDNHGRSRPELAIKQIEAIEEFDVTWFEEPVPPENLDSLELVRRAGFRTQIATGERLYFRWGYKELLARRLADIIQPDVCWSGGISELRRIAAAAETEHIVFAPHNPNGPVACAANIQLCAAVPNFLILEKLRPVQMHHDIQKEPLQVVDGYYELPTTPGLGVDLDEDALARLPEARDFPYVGTWRADDGAVADV